MVVNTKGKLKGYVSPQEVLNFIQQTIDSDAKSYDDKEKEKIKE